MSKEKEYPYEIIYDTKAKYFQIRRIYYKGVNDEGIDSYDSIILHDGRSEEHKERWKKQRVKIPSLNKKRLEFTLEEGNGTPEGDRDAIRAAIYFIFTQPEDLGII